MSEEQNIEQSPEDGKTERPEEVNENISPQETIEQSETQIEKSEIPKSEIENMEVHHHPHVEKKNFKEYLLEGLMIFLAVSMGFVAENIRENISDNRQVNEYMASMVSDLKNDVIMYESSDSLNLGYCRMVDTIFASLKNDNPETGKIYYLARRLTMMGSVAPSPTAKTYQQMTSTGAFRLIKHQPVADSIALYYQLIKSFDNWSDLQRSRVNNMIAANDKVFSADAFFSIYKAIEYGGDSVTKIIQSNPPFVSKDPGDINAVIMQYQYFYGFMKLMNSRADIASAQAKKLIALLEKEYHLENK